METITVITPYEGRRIWAEPNRTLVVDPAWDVVVASGRQVYAVSDGVLPDGVHDLHTWWRAVRAGRTPPWVESASADPREIAVLVQTLFDSRHPFAPAGLAAAADLVVEEELWRHRFRAGLRADRNRAIATRDSLQAARRALQHAVGVDLTRRTAETVHWLQARGVDAQLSNGDTGYARIDSPKNALLDLDRWPELEHWLTADELGKRLRHVGMVANGADRDGRVRPDIAINGADTGRTIYRNPNVTALRKDHRPLLLADPGHVLVSADYANAELRTAAAFVDDPAFTAMVTGTDIYSMLGRAVGTTRPIAKRSLIAMLYGQHEKGLARNVGAELARNLRSVVAQMLPALSDWQKNVTLAGRAGEPLRTLRGRRLPALDPNKAYRAANWLIQGSARDALGEGVRGVAGILGPEALWASVHDELIVQVPRGLEDEAVDALCRGLTVTLPGTNIALPVEAKVFGDRWRAGP